MWPLKSHQKGKSALSLLAILGSEEAREAAAEFAASQRWRLTLASTVEEACAFLRRNASVAVVLVDRDLDSGDWRSVVHNLAQEPLGPSVILASAVVDHYLFEEVVKQGGFDIVSKPLQADELRRTALLAWKFRERRWRERANG